MTDSDSVETGELEADSPSESKPNWRRELESRASEAETELASYKRRDAFRSAGLDPDDARVSYFVKGYEGELNPEAIAAEATAAGFLGSESVTQPGTPPRYDSELAAEQRIAMAGEGGDPVSNPDLDARIKATNSTQELKALMESEGYLWNATV
jgi:hypothetical protein|tara:strand:+ start:415 stop:876 length:462 start_codon:yes stop_codon:yes gene_type:complete